MTSVLADARVLLAMLRGMPADGALAQRLAAFYGPQADRYDRFRDRMLHGRGELMAMLPLRHGDHVVELGGGTGQNALRLGSRLARLSRYTVVDLCPPLLAQARAKARLLPTLDVVEGDAASWTPPRRVDCVVFSYSLTMIPDWQGAIANAVAMVRPGGVVAAVDFYVSRAAPGPGFARHGPLARALWPRWFRHDGVDVGPERLDFLRQQLRTVSLLERAGRLPFLPGLRVPYYLFIGQRLAAGPRDGCDSRSSPPPAAPRR